MESNEKEKGGLGLSAKAILAVLALIAMTPYRYLPKALQNLKNVLESVNPLKRLIDYVTSMTLAEARFVLQPGDHIYCYRKQCYSHHGIYAGDGKVWEYDGKTVADAEVKLSTLEDFSLGEKINRLNYEADFSPEEILKRAASRQFEATYDIFRNNCMHFAFWCRVESAEGAKVSQEVFTLLLNEGNAGSAR